MKVKTGVIGIKVNIGPKNWFTRTFWRWIKLKTDVQMVPTLEGGLAKSRKMNKRNRRRRTRK